MKRQKKLATHFAVFIILLAVLWGLLVLSAMIPNTAIQNNMLKSALSYKEKEAFSFESGGRWNAISDNYADAILLNVSWYMGKGSPLYSTLDTWYYDGEDLGENAGLYLAVSEEMKPNNDYSRYWHGSAMFVRLLHLFMDVKGMKLCGFAGILVLAFVTLVIFIRHGHWELAAALMLSMAAVQLWNTRLSLEYQPAFLLGFLFCILYLWLERKSDFYLTLLSVAGGTAIAFYDFLTTETVVLLLPLILVVSVRSAENRLGDLKDNICLLAKCGGCWLFAYAGTFLVKWTAATLLCGSNKYISAFSLAGERMAGSLEGNGSDNPLLRIPQAVAANLTMLFGGQNRIEYGRVFAGLIIIALLLGSLLYLFYKKSNKAALKLLGVLGSIVILRFIILNNHSYLHEFFTYRALISTCMALFAGTALSIRMPLGSRRRGRR